MGVPEAEAAVDYAYEIYPPGPEGLDDQHIALLRGVLEGVEAKLRDDPRYWRAINAIADRLIEHPLHRLDGVEAAAIMKRAWNAP